MENRISSDQLGLFSKFIAKTMGLHFPSARWPDLQRGLVITAGELGFDDIDQCARSLMSAPLTKIQLEALASNLTVGETYFFRENQSFDILAEHVLPPLILARREGERRLRIWSAACCTGEEPYSIAILLSRIIPDWREWNITLLATDINPNFLRKAEAGIFGNWSFRNAPAWLKEKYFSETPEGNWKILPEIRQMVRFSPLNLAEDIYPSLANDTNPMDVIFCRNVLIYFTASRAQKVIQNLHRAHVEGGWLIVSPTELMHVSSSPYAMVKRDSAIVYQKCDVKSAPLPAELPLLETLIIEPPPLPAIPAAVEEALLLVPTILPAISHELTDDLLARATAMHNEGRYADAVTTIKKLLSVHPGDPQSLRLLARSLANEGKLADALDCCNQLIAVEKLNSTAHYLRAVILREQGKIEEAVGSFRKAIYLEPDFVMAHFAMGNIARGRGQDREREKHLENTLRLLRSYQPDEMPPESEGITAGRFTEIVGSLLNVEKVA
jgi:chemotaxis protein methyltransferase CheR